jgi:diguanylate cyclase (GGDEF)-like protein
MTEGTVGLTTPRILLVEDSATQAMTLRRLLENNGFHVVEAHNGIEALNAVRASRFDLVLSDVEMPEMNGFELCKMIKGDPNLRGIPVVLLSTLGDNQNIIKGLEARADYYLTKPCPPNYLVERLRTFVADSKVFNRTEEDGPLEIVIDGQKQQLQATRRQMLTLLLSTYDNSVQQNRELIQAQLELSQANERLYEQQTQLERLAAYDGLTGLKNSRKFREDFEQAIARSSVTPVALLLVDADHFKQFNDSYGHLAGDDTLKALAEIIRTSIRQHDIAARYGGEEFAVIASPSTVQEAMAIGERIRRNVEQASWPWRKVTVSIGVAISTAGFKTTQSLFAAADQALYASKNAGRNRVTESSGLSPAQAGK